MRHATPDTITPDEIEAIALLEVTSSNIARIGYSAALAVLLVEFKAGSLYAYFGVPDPIAAALVHADTETTESVGRTFGEQIKKHPDRYPFKALRKAPAKPKAD